MNKAVMFLGIGFELVALCLGGYYLGEFIDGYFNWPVKTTAFLIVILLVGWFVHLMFLLKRFEDEDSGPHGTA